MLLRELIARHSALSTPHLFTRKLCRSFLEESSHAFGAIVGIETSHLCFVFVTQHLFQLSVLTHINRLFRGSNGNGRRFAQTLRKLARFRFEFRWCNYEIY